MKDLKISTAIRVGILLIGLAILMASCEKDQGSCFDGIKNQNESSVDCGGICGECLLEENAKPSVAGAKSQSLSEMKSKVLFTDKTGEFTTYIKGKVNLETGQEFMNEVFIKDANAPDNFGFKLAGNMAVAELYFLNANIGTVPVSNSLTGLDDKFSDLTHSNQAAAKCKLIKDPNIVSPKPDDYDNKKALANSYRVFLEKLTRYLETSSVLLDPVITHADPKSAAIKYDRFARIMKWREGAALEMQTALDDRLNSQPASDLILDVRPTKQVD